MKSIIKIFLGLALGTSALTSSAQELPEADVERLVQGRHFVFVPQTMSPQQPNFRNLSGFDLTVTPDTLLSYLPYYGRAFSAPINSSKGALDFTSVKFDYKANKNDRNEWDIVMQPKDGSGVQTMDLTVYDNGRALLRVNSRDRQFISFNGYIMERPVVKKRGL